MPTTTNFGWTTPADTDLVKDGALAIRTLGNGIDTSFLDLKGGTTGQSLKKNSNTDLDFTWAGDATNTVVDAAGDLLYGTAADTLGRLAIGTTGQVLTVSGGVPAWATVASGSSFVGCRASLTSDQTISNNTLTIQNFTTEQFDTDAFHSTSTNTSRFTIPTGKGGKYMIHFVMAWAANTTGTRNCALYKNGSYYYYGPNWSPYFSTSVTPQYDYQWYFTAVAGDYFEVAVNQTSGGNLNLYSGESSTCLTIQYLGA